MRKVAIHRGAHSVHQLYVHFVFVTYWRGRLITKERRWALEACFRDICEKMGCVLVMFESGCVKGRGNEDIGDDHVHLQIRYPPSLALSDLAKQLKGESSFRISRDEEAQAKFDSSRKPFRWSASYFAKTVGHMSAEETSDYIRNQKRKGKMAMPT